MSEAPTLTPEENAVYDRQLRVWGLQVQKRLQRAKILIVGDNTLFSEVAKNVVLAGVGCVVLHAGSASQTDPHGSNFLANTYPDLITTEACVRVLQEMNPLVSVSKLKAALLDVEALRGFDLVCLMSGSLRDQVALNALCREAEIKFCCGRCVGPFGWMFFDLMQHSYTSDTEEPEERHMEFNRLDTALRVDPKRLPKKLHGLYPVLRSWLDFDVRHQRSPTSEDIEILEALASERLPQMALDARILRQYLSTSVEFPPVCAVLGGMLANEIVKIVSAKGDPVQNFLFYDIFDGKGILHLIE